MKRILSLVLVLVMLVSVMPMALAEDTVETTCTHDEWAKEPNSGATEPTCTTPGVKVYACTHKETPEGGTEVTCTGTKTVTTPATGNHTDEDEDNLCDGCGATLIKVTAAASPH